MVWEQGAPALSATGQKAVLVLDRATYHTKLDDDDRSIEKSWNRKVFWFIDRWGGSPTYWGSDCTLKKTTFQLLEYAKSVYPSPKFKIQRIADKFKNDGFEIKILFIPVAHPNLNAIEIVYSLLKRVVASRRLHLIQ